MRHGNTSTNTPDFSSAQPHLADIAGPRRLLLTGRSQQDHGEGLTVGRLHHHFKLQVVEALTCCVVCGNTGVSPVSGKHKHEVWLEILTVLITGVQLLKESALYEGQRSSLLLGEKEERRTEEKRMEHWILSDTDLMEDHRHHHRPLQHGSHGHL